jgi:hypothetical protein
LLLLSPLTYRDILPTSHFNNYENKKSLENIGILYYSR